MEITIKAEPKEIAALVVALQERQDETVSLFCDGKEIYRSKMTLKFSKALTTALFLRLKPLMIMTKQSHCLLIRNFCD